MRWDLAITPQGKGKRITTGGGVGWYLVKPFPYQEEAWAVLQHLTSAETHRLLADVRFPGRRSVLDWWLAQAPDEPPKSRASPHRPGGHAPESGVPAVGPDRTAGVHAQLARLWDNKATAREVAREIAAQPTACWRKTSDALKVVRGRTAPSARA